MKLKLSLAAVFLLAIVHQPRAAVINAASGAYANVLAAVSQAAHGDTVVIPPGTNSWTNTVNISGITLQGSGTNTVIRDETPIVASGNGTPILQLNTIPNFLTRVTQIQFSGGITNNVNSNPNDYNANIHVQGGSPNWRIDHCELNRLTGKNILVDDDSFGLIDHNVFPTFNRIGVEVHGLNFGDADWAAPTQLGSSNAVYIEDNYFTDGNNFGAIDISNGGRAVFRHNTMVGSYFNTHGTETSQRYRSSRYVELYNNSFNWGGGKQYNNFYTVCDIRGGTAVIFSNTAVGYYSMALMDNYRATDNDKNFLPFFGATGLRGWDNNGPAIYNGAATVTSNVLVVAGTPWTSNQLVGCTVYDPSNALCGIISANTANTAHFATSRSSYLQISFNQGDNIVIHHIYPNMDQPGVGQGDLLSGDSPNPVWLNEAAEPVYVWTNSLTVMYSTMTAVAPVCMTSYPNMVNGRDYTNGVARPGYTPYVYPHPLTLMDSTNPPIVVIPPTNSIGTNTVLSPPTNLKAQGL